MPVINRGILCVATVVAITVMLWGRSSLGQRVLHVPGEYPTIQAGIDAAQNDDTVLVAEGTYTGPGNVDLNFGGKAITVRGENGLARINDSAGGARIATFNSAETPLAIFEGFIVQFDSGAGIVIENCSPTIRDCEFNVRTGSPLSMSNSDSTLADLSITGYFTTLQVVGGMPTLERVAIDGTSLEMSGTVIRLTDCSASCNTSGLAYTGGGMSFRRSTATLNRCTIQSNLTFGDEGYESFGGGVYVEESDVNFVECSISHNEAYGHHGLVHGQGGGVYLLNSEARFESCELSGNTGVDGGGVYVEGGSAAFFDCLLRFNSAWVYGGGAYGTGDFTDCIFESNWGQESGGGAASIEGTFLRCTFRDNRVTQSYYEEGFGAGLFTSSRDGPTVIVDCIFDNNSATGPGARGAGAYVYDDDVIRGCTFVSNHADGTGGGIYFDNPLSTVGNSVLWGNTDSGGPNQISGDGSVTWSDVQGGYPGEGNIDEDPRFADPANGDYRLGNASPCIDAGNNDLVPPESEFDLDGNPRFVDDRGTPDMGEGTAPIVDMGCYEFQGRSTGLNLRVNASCPDGGPARIGWANASPDRMAVLLISPDTGTIRIPSRFPCAGTELGLGSSGLRIAWQGRNDAGGGRVLNTTAPPGACGQFMQLLDLSTCSVGDVVQIE